MLKETTILYLETSVTTYLNKSGITSPYQALELREWLLKNTTQSMAKRVLTYVNAAFNRFRARNPRTRNEVRGMKARNLLNKPF